jgi:sigma-B regulation protein RsbU (phosphoserine phosphatase)
LKIVLHGPLGDKEDTNMSAPPETKAAAPLPRLLIADDDTMNREVLTRLLTQQGFNPSTVNDGQAALERLRAEPFDLVLLDVTMPVLDGHAALKEMKGDEALRELPVIMIAGLEDLDSIARCIEAGADDYLPKPFKAVLLRARINACLEKKQLRDQERAAHAALVESQKHLAQELSEAATYVRSLLPEPLTGAVQTEWRFITSTSLGGDSFGYYWLDDDHLAMYLLDVCGHGVGAALLSISAMNVLRSQSLPGTDFRDPGAVLSGLNETFLMERQNDMYFTIWYGVFNKAKREIAFARGGHPPAILMHGDTPATMTTVELKAPGMVIGSMSGLTYRTVTQAVGENARMYLFSDGVYEISKPDGTMWDYAEFLTLLQRPGFDGYSELDSTLAAAREQQGREVFDDDFSMVKFVFPPK